MPYWDDATEYIRAVMARLDRQEAKEMILLSKRWGDVQKAMEQRLQELAGLEVKSPNQLREMQVYQRFVRESKAQVAAFNKDAARVITTNQRVFANYGIESAQETIAMIRPAFRRLPVSAVDTLIGRTSDGSSLYTMLSKNYPSTADTIVRTLINNTARGINPRVTARDLQVNMDGSLYKALRVARTEQMNAFRISSLEQMKESGVVRGWRRIEEEDACDECAQANGREYSLDEPFESHPNCRGTALPIVG